MRIEKFNYNSYDDLLANTYVVSDDDNFCVVIDPSSNGEDIIRFVSKNKLKPKAVLLTHGHFDHIRGVDVLVNEYNIPVYIHKDDSELLTNTYLNCSFFGGDEILINSSATLVDDKCKLDLLKGEQIEVIHTPFHTAGSVCYYFINNKWLFSGDTLFKSSIGRDDLPRSNPRQKDDSLRKLMKFPKDVKVYPGHGSNTDIGSEIKTIEMITNSKIFL